MTSKRGRSEIQAKKERLNFGKEKAVSRPLRKARRKSLFLIFNLK